MILGLSIPDGVGLRPIGLLVPSLGQLFDETVCKSLCYIAGDDEPVAVVVLAQNRHLSFWGFMF